MLTIPYYSRAIPAIKLGDPRFVYVPAASTDVTRIWRKYGWVPKYEIRNP
jgi:hypothetical protein